MTITNAKAQNKSIEWATPQNLFDHLNCLYGFTLDPASTKENAKCSRFFTKEDDGLKQSWKGERVWLNPPYGKELPVWIEKAVYEVLQNECPIVVSIFPPRTDTLWFHKLVSQASELWLLRGRVHFESPDNSADRPQDPSCIAIFEPGGGGRQSVLYWNWKADVK